jgi:hypothetical protein
VSYFSIIILFFVANPAQPENPTDRECRAFMACDNSPDVNECEATLVGKCEGFTLQACLKSSALIVGSEDPVAVLGCDNNPTPYRMAIDMDAQGAYRLGAEPFPKEAKRGRKR